MIKWVVQIIGLVLPVLAFLIFSSCADPQPIDDEFKVTKDMSLIEELHKPDIGLVPIGDRFTMGGAVAALSCRRFFNLGWGTSYPLSFVVFNGRIIRKRRG